MSDGKKAAYEDQVLEAFNAHVRQLEELGTPFIVMVLDDLKKEIYRLEKSLGVMPREGWTTLDRVKDLIKKIS